MKNIKLKKYKIIKIDNIKKNDKDYEIFKKTNKNGGSNKYSGFIYSDYSDLKYNDNNSEE